MSGLTVFQSPLIHDVLFTITSDSSVMASVRNEGVRGNTEYPQKNIDGDTMGYRGYGSKS